MVYKTPLYICDREKIRNKYNEWLKYMGNIKIYYAVKCNPNIEVLKILKSMNSNFDCASIKEIKKVFSLCVEENKIIYTNPIKTKESIKYIKSKNIKKIVFDNEHEMKKIEEIYKDAELILRIITDDSNSDCKMSNKFGATKKEAYNLINIAKDKNLNIIGISFHVGSMCKSFESYKKAIEMVEDIRKYSKKIGKEIKIIDIGGGFNKNNFRQISKNINELINKIEDNKEIEIIAEPGRFMVEEAFILIVKIIGKKVRGDTYYYYINDGIYQSFNCILYDKANPMPIPKIKKNKKEIPKYKSKIFGQTCDGLDELNGEYELPEMDIGDKIIYKNMGAYTFAASSDFNGLKNINIKYIN